MALVQHWTLWFLSHPYLISIKTIANEFAFSIRMSNNLNCRGKPNKGLIYYSRHATDWANARGTDEMKSHRCDSRVILTKTVILCNVNNIGIVLTEVVNWYEHSSEQDKGSNVEEKHLKNTIFLKPKTLMKQFASPAHNGKLHPIRSCESLVGLTTSMRIF